MPRVNDAGDSALLLELEAVIDPAVNARAIAIAAAVRRMQIPGVRDVVSTFRSVAVYFDPLRVDVDRMRDILARETSSATPVRTARTIEVPVAYGGDNGPDLDAVAAVTGLTAQQVIERHAGQDYRVFMLGFLPGFAYMASLPPELTAPRRATPRLRVPAGSVGIAGRQTAVYPGVSPGGWQIIGRTGLRVFDPTRTPPTLFAPGDTVRFVAGATLGLDALDPPTSHAPLADVPHVAPRRRATVLQPGLLTTVQDKGRWGHQSDGVPVSGAMDPFSHRLANALVGNADELATLEVTVAGPELRIEDDATVAVTGADLSASLGGKPMAANTAMRCRAGDRLQFGGRRGGGRAYVAFDGGVSVAAVMGSRATHPLSRMGGVDGRALRAGDALPLSPPAAAVSPRRPIETIRSSGGARVRVLPGPQHALFPLDELDRLQQVRFTISPNSDRMGYRLVGGRVRRLSPEEMISDATFNGGIQVPASGEPILLMADRQTTGGYPQIATVISADIPRVAQLLPGDWIEFEVCSRRDAIAALVAQEGSLLAVLG